MNIINIRNNKIILKVKKREIKCDCHLGEEIFDISKINIEILKDTELEINIYKNDFKADFNINILDNINVHINFFETLEKGKLRFNYHLGMNANLKVNKVNDGFNIKELVVANLDNELAKFKYNLKSVAKSSENYDVIVNHNAKNTISDVKNNVINISGNVLINVSTYIKKGFTGSLADQNNKIINLNNKKCDIKPNLFIDEFDSVANHSAYVGKFNKDELFYLMSRGLDKETSEKMLIKGLLLSDIDEDDNIIKINKLISKYWG